MKCKVCRKDVGFWAKLGNHSQVCKSCAEQGQNRLKVLATSVGWVTIWHQEHADRWLAQCDEIVHKYQVPAVDATRTRDEILNGIFKLVESQEQIADADLEYLVGMGQRYDIAQAGSPELQDTVLRIALRQAIQSWDGGKPLERDCTALVLAKGEVCQWEEPAGLLVQRTKREYVGGYGSVSIPLHIVRGARVRVGGFKGVPIDKTVHEDGGRGVLHITNRRVCFTGLNQAVAIPYNKIVSLAGFDEGFEVHTGNEKKPGIFLVPHPELTTELLKRASSNKSDEGSGPKRPRRLPTSTMAVCVALLAAITLVAGQNAPPSGDSDKPLGDIAKQARPKRAQETTKRIWTSDDFPSAGKTESPVSIERQEASATATLQKFRLLGKVELGVAVLKRANAPDAEFPDRRDWEQRLFEAKQAWLDQVDRMVGHKDSSKAAQDTEIRLAQGAQMNFERISAEGIQQARAVNDPALKAHLQYQKQLDFCRQTSGDLLQKCLASVDQLKWQMQREGTW